MKKKILGITVLLAVVAMGLAFTACPVDTDTRSVIFINDTSSPIIITFKNADPVELDASTKDTPQGSGPRKTATKTGADLILYTIVFTKSDVGSAWENYVNLEGALVAGKEVKEGLGLASGTLTFTPKLGIAANPAGWTKISAIPVDE